jgi:serine/threonine protein kinase
MSTDATSRPRRRGALWNLAVEGVIPVMAGCAGAVAAGPAGGMVGVAVGVAVEKAVNWFGRFIVDRWYAWFGTESPAEQLADLNELADMSPQEARQAATEAVNRLAPQASAADRRVAVDYLSAIPLSVHRSLVQEKPGGSRSLPATVSTADPRSLLQLLPTDVPPYAAPSQLPNSPYRLEELIGAGGFGAVYRASAASLQHLPLAVKFCLDPSLLPALRQERSNLERLMKSGGSTWSPRVVRLYGYDLEHPTPYLVYEFVGGGDLAHWLAGRVARHGKGPSPGEVRALIGQVVEGLAYAHARGLVHRDLKPANVLMDANGLKLADFGIGGAVSRQAAQVSRIGTVASSQLSAADQISLYRGAGTPLYMSAEQRRGDPPDPRHDLYSLGVMWYQFLVGDCTRELHPGWERELAKKFQTPKDQIDLIRLCVGMMDERPADAAVVQRLLKSPESIPVTPSPQQPLAPRPKPQPAPPPIPVLPVQQPAREPDIPVLPMAPPPRRQEPVRDYEAEKHRRIGLLTQVRRLLDGYYQAGRVGGMFGAGCGGFFLGLFLGLIVFGVTFGVAYAAWHPEEPRSPTGSSSRTTSDEGPRKDSTGRTEAGNGKDAGPGKTGVGRNDSTGRTEASRSSADSSSEKYRQDHDEYLRKDQEALKHALLISIPSGGGVFLLLFVLKVGLRARARSRVMAELENRIDQLLTDYPEECRAWGGRAALCDWRAVRDLEYELASRR